MESALQSMNSSENHSFEPDHTLMDLLSILHKSEDTLKELNLTFDGLRPTDNLWLVPFVLQILSSIRGYRCLRLVSFVDTPIPFSLKCGGNHPDSLKFVLEEKREARFVPSEIVELMMTIEDFVGDGFTEFIPAHRTWYGPEESHPTLEQLKGSTSTLKILDLRQDTFADERGLLTFALQFSKLRYLRLSMMAKDEEEFHDDDDDDEEERPEPEPQVIEVAHDIPVAAELKHLDLVVRDYKVDWSSIVRWAGGGLESLRLGLDLKSSGEGRFHHPSFYGLLVFNSRETIKTLHLHILYEEAVDLQEASEVSLNFPNLKKLSLSNVNESTFEAFSKLESPKLQELLVHSIHPASDQGMKCLIENLKRHSTKLIELSIRVKHVSTLPDLEGFDFQYLQKLKVHVESDKSFTSWIAGSHYPVLKEVLCSGRHQAEEFWNLQLSFVSTAPRLELCEAGPLIFKGMAFTNERLRWGPLELDSNGN